MKPTSPINSLVFSSLDLVFDHSKVFRKYLKDEKADVAARKAGVKMREVNEIVPHVSHYKAFGRNRSSS